jgi:hypothetical protein
LAFDARAASLVAALDDGGLCRIDLAGALVAPARDETVREPLAITAACRSGAGHFGALSGDAARLASGTTDRAITLTDARDGRVLARWSAPPSVVALSHDESHAATVGLDRTIRVWDTSTGDRAASASEPARSGAPRSVAEIDAGDPVLSLAISPGGRHVAWSTWSGITTIADPPGDATTTTTSRTISLNSRVRDLDFSRDGRYLLSGDESGMVRIWGIEEQRAVAELALEQPVSDVAFSADGRHVVTASDRVASVRVWSYDDLLRQACARLSRPLSEDDWKLYVGDGPYAVRCPELDRERSAGGLEEARRLLSLGRIESAVKRYMRAARAGMSVTGDDWYRVCREGTIWGRPKAVLDACDLAVETATSATAWRSRGWRGVARALDGDQRAGIEDLEYSLEHMDAPQDGGALRERLAAYIGILRAGGDPFHPDVARDFLD